MFFWDEILLEVVFAFPNPTIALENETRSICTIIYSNDNLWNQEVPIWVILFFS